MLGEMFDQLRTWSMMSSTEVDSTSAILVASERHVSISQRSRARIAARAIVDSPDMTIELIMDCFARLTSSRLKSQEILEISFTHTSSNSSTFSGVVLARIEHDPWKAVAAYRAPIE